MNTGQKQHSAALRAQYRHRLRGARPQLEATLSSLESADGGDELSGSAITERVSRTDAELHRIVTEVLGDRTELHDLATQIVQQGQTALRRLSDDDETLTEDHVAMGELEAIIQTDGSRPSFLIRNGVIDETSSPAGNWLEEMLPSAERLAEAINCVGRIDRGGKHVGTGFLIHENLILTNRHVLEAIAFESSAGFQFKSNVSIDFAKEFQGIESKNLRTLKRVLFYGKDKIGLSVNHSRLDLVLIELEPRPTGAPALATLSISNAPDWAGAPVRIVTIGYPGAPIPGQYSSTLVDQLFQSTFSYKRLAPGEIISSTAPLPSWSLCHDATTLRGCSGSVVLIMGHEEFAAGIHYGGRTEVPAANWGHVLGGVLETPGATVTPAASSGKSLQEWLTEYGVMLKPVRG